tara:strand:- start:20554 stop:20913 length:360 start_codon:yes stop_codon:yes gene_type:complete
MSKSDYSVSTVYYNNLDSGEYITKGKSFKSFQLAVKNFNLLWDTDDSYISTDAESIVLTVMQHLVCSLKHYKYNQSAKKLLQNIFILISDQSIDVSSYDDLETCTSIKELLKSAEEYIH